MIKSINGGRYITVTGGMSSDPYISPGSVGAGMLRWNPNMNCMEVNDGNTWKAITYSYPSIDLNSEAIELLDYVKAERAKEKEMYALASTNEAVRIALEQLEQAKTRLELTSILAKEHEQTTS